MSVNETFGYGMPYGEFAKMFKPQRRYEDQHGYVDYSVLGDTLPVSVTRLFVTVGEKHIDHIMIFPTFQEKKEWHPRGHTHLYGETTYLDEPFTPYLVYMDRNGVPVGSHGGDPALIPGIPRAMREWLLCGVFDLTGVAKLRPMVVEWWG